MELKKNSDAYSGDTEVLIAPSAFVNESEFRNFDDILESIDADEIERRNKSGRFISDEFGAYQDTYKYLKQQMDFTYVRYKDQLRSLSDRKNKVKKDMTKSISTVTFMFLLPFIYVGILFLLRWMDTPATDIIFMIFLTLVGPVLAITLIAFTPAAFKELNNRVFRFRVLGNDSSKEKYRKKNKIITFEDEKKFLKRTIMEFDDFYKEAAIEGYGTADGNEAKYAEDLEALDVRREKVLEKMRRMAEMKEHMAILTETKKEVGIGWMMIGVVLAVAAGVVYIFVIL